MTKILSAIDDAIAEAATVLKQGGLVAMPTETVYGLAANALDSAAVARVFEAKERPQFNPLISHFADIKMIEEFAVMEARAKTLAHKFWPGPLTLVLPKTPESKISELVTAGLDTMAVRMPAHPVARALLQKTGFPLAAPSANRSGRISATTPAHVAEELNGRVDIILAAGPARVGIESTVLDLSGDKPVLLRPGSITREEIAEILEEEILMDAEAKDAPRSPGQLLRHYAPETKLRLNAIDLQPGEALLAFGPVRFMGIKGGGAAKDLPGHMRRNLSEEADLTQAAANLFSMLKELDKAGAKGIAVMNIPDYGLGVAINDRLKRAAG